MGKARLYRVKVNWNWSIFCVDLKVHSEKLEYLTDRGKRVLDFWAFQPKAIITKISFHLQKYLCLHVLPIACTTQCNNALKDRKKLQNAVNNFTFPITLKMLKPDLILFYLHWALYTLGSWCISWSGLLKKLAHSVARICFISDRANDKVLQWFSQAHLASQIP